MKIKTDKTGQANVPCPYCDDKYIGGCACIRCDHWRGQVLSADGILVVECVHEGTSRCFDVPLSTPPLRQQEVASEIFRKISLLVGVDEQRKKEITLSSPTRSYCLPAWSVSLTVEEARDLGLALIREVKK
ncbi:MAG: hypothetical protein WC372_07325 [Candidatus Neomarinimicrobiota bacterium]|jgi:hypothetical protein